MRIIFHQWNTPTITQSFNPNLITLSLTKSDDKRETISSDDKKVTIKTSDQKAMIVEYLTDHAEGRGSELADLLGVKTTRVKQLIYELVADGIVVAQGGNRNRTYKLKA